jgi:hypothetical protein
MISLGFQHVCVERGSNVHNRLLTYTTVYKRNNGTFYAMLPKYDGFNDSYKRIVKVELTDMRKVWKQVPFAITSEVK